jgi:hypothetical protein
MHETARDCLSSRWKKMHIIHVYDMDNILCRYDIYIYMTTIFTKIHLYVAILALCHIHNTNSVILGA